MTNIPDENKQKPPVKPPLADVVRELVKQRKRGLTLKSLAASADCSPQWLSKFIAGTIADPGVSKIVALYDILNDTPLTY